MLVYCNKPYVLKVDDVEWAPIGTSDGADLFLLSTSGIVEVFVDGSRIFFFRNSIVLDYEIGTVTSFQRNGRYGANLFMNNSNGTYIQARIGSPEVNTIRIVLEPSTDLEITASQGSVNVANNDVFIESIDNSDYVAIFAGNTLVAFFLPVE